VILTITLNPAVDKTIKVNNLTLGHVNRIVSSRQDAGGKGINVSKMIQVLGDESTAFAVIGGDTGAYIKSEVESMGINFEYVELEKATRTNIKIVDDRNQVYTDLNSSGSHIDINVKGRVDHALEKLIQNDTLVVLSGSAHNGFGVAYYHNLIKWANAHGARVILDADGDLLKEAIEAKPYLVKPNIHELEKLTGKTLATQEDVISASQCILDKGVTYVVVSMGEEGALCMCQDGVYSIKGMKVPVKSTVGAGDSMVAGLAVGIHKNLEIQEIFKLGSVSATSAVMTEGSSAGRIEDIEQLKTQIRVTQL